MRLVCAAALALALAAPAAAAKAKASSPSVSTGRRFFARIYQTGRLVKGLMVRDAELPTDRMYKESSYGTVAVDSSWCTAYLAGDGSGESAPARAIDRGCTGTMATTEFDWGHNRKSRMTQSRLDRMYAAMLKAAFGE